MIKQLIPSDVNSTVIPTSCDSCHHNTSSNQLSDTAYVIYGCVMLVILTLGLFGNGLTILVLRHREHRDKTVVPFLLNLSCADILVIGISYSSSINALMSPRSTMSSGYYCSMYALVDGIFECASIASLCALSGMMYWGIVISKYNTSSRKITSFKSTVMVLLTWAYALAITTPTLFGWGRVVPAEDEIMCTLDWASHEWEILSYNVFLLVASFFLPLLVIFCCYTSVYRFMRRPSMEIVQSIQLKQIYNERIIVRITLLAVTAFIISWLPSCIVSLISMFKGEIVAGGKYSLMAETMAKACVLYNPCIYVALNKRFRITLRKLITGRHRRSRRVTNAIAKHPTEAASVIDLANTSSMTVT